MIEENVKKKLGEHLVLKTSLRRMNSLGPEKSKQIRGKSQMSDQQHIKQIIYNFKNTRGCIDLQDVLTFEPHGLLQKVRAMGQNTYEVTLLLMTVLICFYKPSFLSIGFLLLNHNVLYFSTWDNKPRLSMGRNVIFFNIFVLLVVVCWKMHKIEEFQTKFEDRESYNQQWNYLESLGFKMENEKGMQFKILKRGSVMFEIWMAIAYLVTLARIFSLVQIISQLEQNFVKIIMIKNFEYEQMTCDSDDEVEEKTSIGFQQKGKEDSKELRKEKKRKYKKQMQMLRKTTPLNFLGCFYFQRLNKMLYILIIFLQLLHSMSFNSLFEIPQLLLILTLFGFFAFRKYYSFEYGLLNFFVAYYFQFTLMFKLTYWISTEIGFVNMYISSNRETLTMRVIKLALGHLIPGRINSEEFWYFLSLLLCITSIQMWKQAKWIDIRDKVKRNPEQFKSNYSQFWVYLKNRSELKSIQDQLFHLQQEAQKRSLRAQYKRNRQTNPRQKTIMRYGKGSLTSIKKSLNKYLPTLVLWAIRILLTFQAYMYHTRYSLGHLLFVLVSFIMNQQIVLFFSAVVMIPLYTLEFVLVYGLKIPLLKDTPLFQYFGNFYDFEMQNPIAEQLLYFVILILFFLTASCFKLGSQKDQNEILIFYIYSKISSKGSSLGWKILFFFLKYIQTIALIAIFIQVSDKLNHLRNLGFMLFFVFYTASEYLYRKTSKLLVLFIAFFIIGQYYFSLVYHSFENNQVLMDKLAWLNIYEVQKMPSWKIGDSIYFRHTPYPYDWMVLLIMCLLNFINVIFINEGLSKELTNTCYETVRDQYADQIFALLRFKNSVSRYMIFIAMVAMFYFIGRAQTNLINWGFFVLNILNFAFIAKGDNKESTLRWSMLISILIKVYSAFFLIFETFFISFVGEKEKPLEPNSLDQKFKQMYPSIYNNLDLIGLRLWIQPGLEGKVDDSLRAQNLRDKFLSYISYLMIAIYLTGYFKSKLNRDKGLDKYTEEEFKDVFQFETDSKRKERLHKKRYQEIVQRVDHFLEQEEDYQNYTSRNDTHRDANEQEKFEKMKKQSILHNHKEIGKKYYSYLEFLDIYENIRFTTPFVVYKWMDYWPLFDIMASYGHIVNNMIIVLIAINYNVSLFMCFNIGCVCLFYSIATYRLNQKAMMCYKESGLQSQTDLKIAKMVTKNYKTSAFCVFLRIRHTLWKIQFVSLIFVSILGFLSTLLSKYRNRLNYIDPVWHKNSIDAIDKVTFYVFMAGLYKDNREGLELYFYVPLFVMTIGFIMERNAINWLTNRHGLTYNRLQKCIEFDLRRDSITQNWNVQPQYSIEHYKSFYYGGDFQELKARFVEDVAESEEKRKNVLGDQIRDYIPYKVAVRIKEFITFSVKLAGRSPDLKIDSKTEKILEHFENQVYASEKLKQGVRKLFINSLFRESMREKMLPGLKNSPVPALKLKQLKQNENAEQFEENQEVETRRDEFYFTFDFESVPLLRDHKVRFYERKLQQGIERKYKISFYKGVQLVFETLTLLILMVSVVLKSNIFSIFYLVFMLKYFFSRQKVRLLVRMVIYIAGTFFVQYAMFAINLTSHTTPAPFPEQFKGYPKHRNPDNFEIKYEFPVFFKFEVFRDLKMAYLVGIGVEKIQVSNLLLDFLNLYLVSMYILHYRNPLLVKTVEKIFWSFPSVLDPKSKWDRLTERVKLQVRWLYQPSRINEKKYEKSCQKMRKNQKEFQIAQKQYEFAIEYNEDPQNDLNQILINYIDLKYNEIWSFDKCREVKMEFKQQCSYFRLVKQGSILVYLTLHIFTILLILLMAALRQSFMALGYVILVLPNINDASQVLIQRNIHLDSKQNDLEKEIEDLEKYLGDLNKKISSSKKRDQTLINERNKTKVELWDKKEEQITFKRQSANKTFEQKQDEKEKMKKKEWYTLKMIKTNLLSYALLDFFLQIACQMPILKSYKWMEIIGMRKVWEIGNADNFTYKNFINHQDGGDVTYSGYQLNTKNFYLQCINCVMICMLSLQTEIFESAGYKKFVTQRDGSMDLLMQLSDLKAQSLAYCFNNHKIRKIISFQRRKESIYSTVEKIKMKLIQWRRFSRNVLEVDGKSTHMQHKQPLLQGYPNEEMGEFFEQSPSRKSIIGNSPQKKAKNVKFGQNDVDIDENNFQIKKAKGIKKIEGDIFRQNLAIEFVQAKIQKLNWMSKLYLYLNDRLVTKIMLKNEKDQLLKLLKSHSTGAVETPTELEQIMYEDAHMLINKQYDNKEGSFELYNLIAKARGKANLNMLDLTNLDKKIKLSEMKRTWEFTRPASMMHKLLETFFYIIISNTQNLIYLSMMFSMYANAGILSIVYPISLFGYALIEETRPRKEYWVFIRSYTSFLVFIKFIANLAIMNPIFQNQTFKSYQTYLKIGLYDYQDLYELLKYMLPEIWILTFLMLNDIQLRLLGLYYNTEKDIETVQDGIERNIESGDFEKVKKKKILSANMCLANYFQSHQVQVKIQKQIIEDEMRKQAIENGIDPLMMNEGDDRIFKEKLHFESVSKKEQLELFKQISKEIWKSSRKFDIDTTSKAKISPFDLMVKENVLQKSLETDNLVIVEGKSIMSMQSSFHKELREEINQDRCNRAESNGDFKEDLDEKIRFLEGKTKPVKDFFDKSPYFDNLFPRLKIQKPGYDLYGSSTVFLAILAIYIFLFYSMISVDQAALLDSVKDSNNIFKGEMAVTLIIVIAIIIIERYVNRSDTKAMSKKNLDNQTQFFKDQEMFKTSSQDRSMTIQLQTMKTADLDVQGNSSQEFLKAMYGQEKDGSSFDSSKTRITHQQKCKFVMHWIILIGSHLFIFWYIPISGNTLLYGTPECDQNLKDKYGCKNFHSNPLLRILYIIISIYLMLSALQMKYGFTIMKKASSVLQYNNSIPALVGAQIFMAIPFAIEVRCLLDFTFSKTALDVFQFWQLFLYHIELFICKNGNISYTYKILGSQTRVLDKCIFGVLISVVILGLLIGPIYFFSDYGGFIAPNPVQSGIIQIALIITKKVSLKETVNQNEQIISPEVQITQFNSLNLMAENLDFSDQNEELTKERPFIIYENKYPFFRQYDEEFYNKTQFNEWTETRYFKPEMLQDCVANEFSDDKWILSDENQIQLKSDLIKAMDPLKSKNYHFKLGIYYSFDRALPAEAITASGMQYKELDFNNLYDCQSGQQLKKLSQIDCTTPTFGYTNNATVRFSQVLGANVVLGSSKNVSQILREGANAQNELHDLILTYSCNNQWTAHASSLPVNIPQTQRDLLKVNNQTCEPLNREALINQMNVDKNNQTLLSELEKNDQTFHDDVVWYRVKFTLFSMMVSASIFASFNITTFYTTIVIVAGSSIRPLLMFGTWTAFVYESTHPDPIIKLIEACYMKRHEEDLIGEEETYRMLQEIVRSPQLFKSMCGSSLKGACDPLLDKLSHEDIHKLQHLDKLERKGYQVQKLKDQITKNRKADDDYNF